MKHTILLVDDDMDDRQLFHAAIASDEVTCITLDHGSKLIGTLRSKSPVPDVIFLDVNMPGYSGWKCLNIIKEHPDFSTIPVIMYSTSKHLEDINKAKAAGAICFFTKPSDFEVLKRSLHDVIMHLEANSLGMLCTSNKDFYE